MKQIFSLTSFLIIILLLNYTLKVNSSSSSNLKSKSSSAASTVTATAVGMKSDISQVKELWEELFPSVSRGTACTDEVVGPTLNSEEDEEEEAEAASQPRNGWGKKRPSFKWIKKWGFGPVAYLIDFLDPLFRKEFLDEIKTIISDLAGYDKVDTNEEESLRYEDPFDMRLIAKPDNELKTDADIKKINPLFSMEEYKRAFNAFQLNKAIKDFNWVKKGQTEDSGYDFIVKHDESGDGRLNYIELIRGIIWNHRNRESIACYDCLHFLAKKLSALFSYIDCQGKGYVTAEELWEKFPDLNRGEDAGYNIFKGKKNTSIRTAAVNDFILKNSKRIDAGVTRDEFISGILLGFAQRHVTPTSVFEDEKLTMKNIRWG